MIRSKITLLSAVLVLGFLVLSALAGALSGTEALAFILLVALAGTFLVVLRIRSGRKEHQRAKSIVDHFLKQPDLENTHWHVDVERQNLFFNVAHSFRSRGTEIGKWRRVWNETVEVKGQTLQIKRALGGAPGLYRDSSPIATSTRSDRYSYEVSSKGKKYRLAPLDSFVAYPFGIFVNGVLSGYISLSEMIVPDEIDTPVLIFMYIITDRIEKKMNPSVT